MKLLILLILIIGIFSNNVYSQFNTNQQTSLQLIATNCGFAWNSMSCGTTSNTNGINVVNCDSNGNIIDIRFESTGTKVCGLADDIYNYFPDLETLIVNNLAVSTLSKTIYQHPKIQTFISTTSAGTFSMTTNDGSNSWAKMISLKTLSIANAIGVVPNFPNSIQSFSLVGAGGVTDRMPFEIFTTNLTSFSLTFTTSGASPPAITLKNYPLFSMAPNLEVFFLYYNNYPTDFNVFYKAPESLTRMQIYALKLSNTTFPTIGEVTWDGINVLVLNALYFTGTVGSGFFFLNNLGILYLQTNTLLGGTIPSNIASNTKLSQVYLSYTSFSGTIPSDILEGSITILDISNTKISGVVPDIFLCLPSTVFTSSDINYKILLSDNKFTNFMTLATRSPCVPSITSYTNPIDSSVFSITIQGNMLGSYTPFTQVTMKNTVSSSQDLYCQVAIPGKKILCNNPGIFGYGNLTVISKNLASPTPQISVPFKYSEPVISSVTPLKTVGGLITIFGSNLFISSTQANISPDYNFIKLVKNDGTKVNCTNIQVISAFSTLSCLLPAGIQGGQLQVSVSGQTNPTTWAFNYQGPVISNYTTSSNNLVLTNSPSNITINGYNFWNDTSLTSVLIDSNECDIKSLKDNEIVCLFPSIPFKSPDGALDISVFVNGQGSYKTGFVHMVDPSICPNNCGHFGLCDPQIGQCMCSSNTFGPACSLNTTESSSTISIENNKPTLMFSPTQSSNDTQFSVYLVSIVEGSTETNLDSWDSKDLGDDTYQYTYNGNNGQQVIVTIRSNSKVSKDQFITYPTNSYTYNVQYKSSSNQAVDLPQFKFQLEPYPYECTSFPFNFGYPTSSTSDLRFFSLNTYDVQYYGRTPIKAYYNSQNLISTITTSVVSNTGNYSRIVAQLNQYSVNSAEFEFDFTTFSNTIPREPVVSGCILPTKNSNTENNDTNNGWKIGVGIGVGIGGGLLVAAAFLIIKQKMKLEKTQSLLDKKLKEINGGL